MASAGGLCAVCCPSFVRRSPCRSRRRAGLDEPRAHRRLASHPPACWNRRHPPPWTRVAARMAPLWVFIAAGMVPLQAGWPKKGEKVASRVRRIGRDKLCWRRWWKPWVLSSTAKNRCGLKRMDHAIFVVCTQSRYRCCFSVSGSTPATTRDLTYACNILFRVSCCVGVTSSVLARGDKPCGSN